MGTSISPMKMKLRGIFLLLLVSVWSSISRAKLLENVDQTVEEEGEKVLNPTEFHKHFQKLKQDGLPLPEEVTLEDINFKRGPEAQQRQNMRGGAPSPNHLSPQEKASIKDRMSKRNPNLYEQRHKRFKPQYADEDPQFGDLQNRKRRQRPQGRMGGLPWQGGKWGQQPQNEMRTSRASRPGPKYRNRNRGGYPQRLRAGSHTQDSQDGVGSMKNRDWYHQPQNEMATRAASLDAQPRNREGYPQSLRSDRLFMKKKNSKRMKSNSNEQEMGSDDSN